MSEIDCAFTFDRVAAFRSARALRLDGVVARRPGVATQLFCVLVCPRTFQVGVRQRVQFTAFGGSVTVGGRASGFAWDPRCVIETHGNLLVVTGPSPARWGFTVPLGVLPQGAVETIRGWIRDALPGATVPVPDRTPGSLLLGLPSPSERSRRTAQAGDRCGRGLRRHGDPEETRSARDGQGVPPPTTSCLMMQDRCSAS